MVAPLMSLLITIYGTDIDRLLYSAAVAVIGSHPAGKSVKGQLKNIIAVVLGYTFD